MMLSITRISQLFVLIFVLTSCSSGAKKQTEEGEQSASSKVDTGGDGSYILILRFIDNRAVVHINDSIIYDTETVSDELNTRIDLTEYVEQGKSDLRVDLYNGRQPYITTDSHWKFVYDIYVNGELAEFVREEKRDGKIGLVHSESHDLKEIW